MIHDRLKSPQHGKKQFLVKVTLKGEPSTFLSDFLILIFCPELLTSRKQYFY